MQDKDKESKEDKHKVHVTALYTSTAADKSFVARQEDTVADVIEEAYKKLEETRRAGDRYFCHSSRTDLTPYMNFTLADLKSSGICVHEDTHRKLIFEFDIDSEPGGAHQ